MSAACPTARSHPNTKTAASTVYNPSATVAGLSQYLWHLEQPAHAAANGYFMGCINRVGTEAPWNVGKFYGSSYFVDPRGQIFAQASEDKDELLVAEFDLDMIDEVRNVWHPEHPTPVRERPALPLPVLNRPGSGDAASPN